MKSDRNLIKYLLRTRDDDDYIQCASGNVTRRNGRKRFTRENVRNRPSSPPLIDPSKSS